MTGKADQIVEAGSVRLRQLSERLAAKGGLGAKLADELADDADFLRKLKPSLMVKRARGEAPTNQPAGSPSGSAPGGPQLGPRPKKGKAGGAGGPNPFVVIGAALVAGIVLAKVVDWRGHAHPRG